MKQYGISITHKFETEVLVFRRGVRYTKGEIIQRVFDNKWYTPTLSKEENIRRIMNAIRHNCRHDVRRMRSINRGEYYIFL